MKRGMTNFQDLLDRLPAAGQGDLRQDRVPHGTERLGYQGRTDQPRRIARAKCEHAAAPALRHGQRKQIAHQIDDVLEIVGKADPLDGVGAHALAVGLGQTDRSADARMEAEYLESSADTTPSPTLASTRT
jgi:hypothetical protein